MNALAFSLFWWFGLPAGLPPLEDLERFPGVAVCRQQCLALARHHAWLLLRRQVNGWQGGAWDTWLADVDGRIAYWRLLESCHDSPFGHDSVWNRRQLSYLRLLIGAGDYSIGWHPDLLPEHWLEPPPKPMPGSIDGRAA